MQQFFLRTADADVGRYLRLFTFLPLPEINELMAAHAQDPSKRSAQRRLALEVIQMIHGQKEAEEVETQSRLLFPATTLPPAPPTPIPIDDPKAPALNVSLNPKAPQISSQYPSSSRTTLPRSLVYNQPIARILFAAGLVASRSEGHRLAANQGAYIGGHKGSDASKNMGDALSFSPITNWKPAETEKYVINGALLILRVGKWKIKIVNIIPDDEFDAKGLDAPGWRDWKEGQKVYEDEEKAKEVEAEKAATRKRSFRANLAQAKLRKQLSMNREQEERFTDVMGERYSARNPAEAPEFAERVRREPEWKEKGKERKEKKKERKKEKKEKFKKKQKKWKE